MHIPADLTVREQFYTDLIEKCNGTRDSRMGDYSQLRHFYLFGRGPDEDETPYNKIYPHIDTLTSFLFASETTRFSTHLPDEIPETEYLRVPTVNKVLNDVWLRSNSDHVFSQVLTWAMVYGSCFVKVIIRDGELFPFLVDPGAMGVLREDLPYTDRQEAMVHSYYTTKSQLDIDLKDHPNRKSILDYITASYVQTSEQPSGINRLILTASQPDMIGNVNTELNSRLDYVPRVAEDLVELNELWVWDDAEGDYRVVTRASCGITIYDRKNFFVRGEHPFVHVVPLPMYSYFWGMSEVAGMIGLQKSRNDRTLQVQKLLDQQVRPPTAMTGWQGLLEEKQYAMFNEGSYISTDSMQAKIERFAPDLPNDIFLVIHEIDQMFAEKSGLQNILMGKSEVGVRSGRQTSELARLSSARIRKRALVIEDALEALVTLYLKCLRKYDDTEYKDDKGNAFVLDQFTTDFTVKVDAHSNSPLFIEDQKALAVEMLELHSISRERFIKMIDPPDKALILRELKAIEEQEAKQAQMKMQMEAAKHPKSQES